MEYTNEKWVVVPTGIAEYPYCIDTEDKEVAKIHGLQNNAETKANAHLIASAPDLYEALGALITAEDEGFEQLGYGRSQNARQAIAKAEGK